MASPFPELEPYMNGTTSAPPPPKSLPEAQSWLDQEIQRDRDQQVRQTIANAPNPDQVARATRVAREAGVPPLMIDNRLDEAEKGLNAQKTTDLMGRYPAIGKWAASNPRGAATASDDHESLGLMGSAWEAIKSFGSHLPATGKAAYYGAARTAGDFARASADFSDTITYPIEATIATIGDMTGAFHYDPDVVNAKLDSVGRNTRASLGQRQAAARPTYSGPIEQGLQQGLESLPQSLIAIAGGVMTRNPETALAVMAQTTGASGYVDARESGKNVLDALRYGGTQGLVEAGTEKIPAGSLIEAIAKKTPFGKSLVRQLGEEMQGEQVATFLQDFTEWASLHPEKTISDFWKARPDAALQTALGVASGTTVQTAVAHATARAADLAGSVAGRVSNVAQARSQAKVINEAGQAAESSKLRERDPVAHQELVGQMAEDANQPYIHIDGQAAAEYMQSDSYDPRSDPLSGYENDIHEAAASGGDFVLPTDIAFSKLPGTPAWEALKDHMRLTPGGMSNHEAQTFEDAMANHMADLSKRMDAQESSQKAEQTAREKLTETIATKLGDSYTAPAARQMAEVTAQYLQTRAARQGIELKGDEFDHVDINQVMPEALAAARKADATDLVIHALRQGGDASKNVGKSLIEWIAGRGGVNDTGGDLVSMGLGEWHKAKAFRKKAIRAFDPELSMGLTGAGDFGLDTTLKAAIEAGYFPDLANAANEPGVSGVDASTLIDAINAELAGNPVYSSAPVVDHMRAAAEDLRQMLSEAGHDPEAMTDADMRAAIEAMSEAGPAGGFEQPAYHGSPHIFDRFSTDAIGTGEGAQAFGWGLYFAGRKEIADFYRSSLAGAAMPTWGGKPIVDIWTLGERDGNRAIIDSLDLHPSEIEGVSAEMIEQSIQSWGWAMLGSVYRGGYEQNRGDIKAGLEAYAAKQVSKIAAEPLVRDKAELASQATLARAIAKSDQLPDQKPGRTYHVEIPGDDEYLLWDKPLNEQSDKVKAALKALGFEPLPKPDLAEITDPLVRPIIRKALELNEGSSDHLAHIIDNDYDLYQKADRLARRAGLTDEDIENLGGTGFYVEQRAEAFLKRLRAYEGDNVGHDIYRQISVKKAEEAGKTDAHEGNGWQVANPTEHRDDKAASLALHNSGVAGIKYLDGSSRTDGDGSHNYVVFDDSRVSIKAYEQEARARVVFDQGRVIIELFQTRNLSSYFHEFGHMALENLRADAEIEGAPDSLKADWQTVQDWFKANGHPITDGIPVEAHELWARGFERYLMEGKAPTSALSRIFETIRSWMVSLYKTVDQLRSPITPQIREVMDRLVATDEEIEAAKAHQALSQLFKDAASVGMSDAEFTAYQSQIDSARAEANSKLVDKTLAAFRRRETERYKDMRKSVEAETQADVDARPLYRALRNLKTSPIDAQWIRDEMGQDALGLLPKRVPPIARDNGANPSGIAELSGYGTGREMVEALIGAELAQRQAVEGGDERPMRKRTIETETDAEMNRRVGDPLNDGSIEREALAAVHNDMQGEVIASEIRVLARKSGKRPTPYALAKEWAHQRVRAGTVTQEASAAAIQRHARAAAKAGRAAEAAMLEQNIDEAFRQKQFQMLNNALLSEAKAAFDEVESAVKRLGRVAAAKTMKSVDQDYLEQAQALLEAVDIRRRSQVGIDKQGSWEAWANARQADGFDIVVPPSFEATLGKTNWSRLTVENLLALDEAVKQVMHLGRYKQTLLDNKERRDFEEVVSEAENGAGNINGKPPHDLMEPSRWDAIKAGVSSFDSALLKMETVFDWLDGGNSNGVFNRIAFRPIAEAQGREQDMLADYYGRIKALFGSIPEKTLKRWTEPVTLPFTDRDTGRPVRISRQQLISAALNTGNAGNLQRLTAGYGWNAGALQAHLNAELTAEEWQFVQGVWDTIETLWPQIAAMERAINGVAPDKIEATEIVTPFGTMRGGYFPAVYDSTRDLVAEEQRGKEGDLFDAAYTRASTRSSATKDRSEKVSRPILLDLGVINRHLGEVIHDITHREAVMQAHKFLTNRRVMAAVDQALGPEIRKQFRPWVKFVANSWAMERAGNEGIGKFFNKLRANATAVGMGFRLTTALTQVAGFSNSIEVVGERWMTEAIARTSASPIDSWNFVRERSDEVRHRMDTLDRDIRLAISQGAGKADLGAVKRFMYHGIGYMDRVVVVPTWIGAYNKALSQGMSEEDAGYAGDKAVRASQGAGSPKDLAAISRGTGQYGKLLQLFTMFYSYFSATYQRERTLGRDIAGSDTRRARNIPKLMARAWWLLVVPPLLTEVLKAGLTGNGGPDDDEWWLQWTARKMLANALGPIPFVRDAFEPTWNAIAGNKVFGYSMSPLQRVGDSAVMVGSDINKLANGDDTKHATKDVLEATGYATGLVPGQVASAAQFLVDVGSGDADPQDFSDWIEGLTTGRVKD